MPANKIFAQDIANIHLEKVQDEGLSNEFVNSITQDKNGFMWIGTREGLFRYDGYSFEAFRNFPGDSTTLANNEVLSLYPDGKNLWVGSVGGLSCIDIDSQGIKNIRAPQTLLVTVICPKNDSVLYIGTYTGVFQYNKINNSWAKIKTIDANALIGSITDDKKGHLYITSRGGFYCYNKLTGACKHYDPDVTVYPAQDKSIALSYTRSVFDTQGNLWMGVWDGGLLRFNTQTAKVATWLNLTDDVHVLPFKIVLDLLPDNNGNLWLATKEGGLTIFNPGKNKFFNYPVEWGSENNLSGGVVCLFKDKSGIVWIGTENGIFKYDPHRIYLSKTTMRLKTGTGFEQIHDSPITILKESSGLWWMGTYNNIFLYDPKTGILQDYTKRFHVPRGPLAIFNILQGAEGTLWFTAKNLLMRVSKTAKSGLYNTEIYQSPDIKSTIVTLYIDHEKRMWIGTSSNGIYRFDPSAKKFISYHYNVIGGRYYINRINAFCELSKDSILFGGVHTGLLLLHANTGRYEKIHWGNAADKFPDLSVNAICKKGNDIWIGTNENGLWQTDTQFKKTLMTTINDGLPSMVISTINSDDKNNLWMISNSGAVEYHTPDKKITVFDKKDGIQNVGELNSMVMDKGNVFIGDLGCIYNFDSGVVVKNTQPPKVFITDLKVFDKAYNTHTTGPIELNYNQNYFSLEYVALNYTHSKLNRYAYKMDGLDTKWNDAGPRRYVSYANLQEGRYVFNVKACNNEGVWNNIPAKLVIIINPPFWHMWWFYSLSVLAILTVLYIAYIYNINQLKIRMQLRDKIARDLHDDIGSTLSGINIFSRIALQKLNPDQTVSRELLEKISTRSEKTLDALSDIVWSINTRNDGMDNFIIKAKEYLSEVLEPQGIAHDFIVDPEVDSLKMGMASRKELYLIFKEAVYNAYKYSQCSFIHITLKKHKDNCVLIINDNGKGFDINKASPGNGIYNMKQRAGKMKGMLLIVSEENKGTTITLNFRIPRFR